MEENFNNISNVPSNPTLSNLNCIKTDLSAVERSRLIITVTAGRLRAFFPKLNVQFMALENVFTRKQVAENHTTKAAWIIHKNKVYDITEFLDSHPGGEEILLQYGGKDVTNVMNDPSEHEHSDIAYDMLEEYCIGKLDTLDSTDTVANSVSEMNKKQKEFIDLNKPLFSQVWNSGWSKKYYLENVHNARHAKFSPRIFENPYMDLLSKTPWYVIPIFWTPIITLFFRVCISQYGWWSAIGCFPIGLFLWTVIEYTLHRFLFHVDDRLPDNRVCITLHFLLHGIHHFLPMDRYHELIRLRLVMPPALGLILATPFIYLGLSVFPYGISHGIIGGVLFGFMMYDQLHCKVF